VTTGATTTRDDLGSSRASGGPAIAPRTALLARLRGNASRPIFACCINRPVITAFLLIWFASASAEPLKVCVNQDDAPHSFKAGRGQSAQTGGYDLKLLQIIAQRLNLPLKLTWFSADFEKEVSVAAETAALLGSGACDLVAGQPLYAPTLAAPNMEFAKAPDYDGAPPKRQRPFVKVEALAASTPYRASAFGVVVRDASSAPIASLADLKGKRIAIGAGTMPGGIIALYRNGLLQKDMVSLSPGQNPLEALAEGRADATLIELHRFDAYKLKNPQTTLTALAWRHRIQFNFGFVALQSRRDLIAQINPLIGLLAQSGELAALAQGTGLTYLPPLEPAVRPAIGIADLRLE
jgi:ABC-type amino acid transport substrate-binding protein